MDPLIWQDYAPLAACLAALALVFLLILAGRALIVLARHHDVQALRLVAEQSLAAQHGAQLATEQRLGELTTRIAQEQGETRVLLAQSLRALATDTAAQLEKIRDSVNEQLREAVQRQMQSSFERVIDQFTAVQKAMVDVQAVTAQIGDLKRVFANVKSRGGWGETQLKALLDDLLPEGGYVCNARLREASLEVVEFAVKMPMRGEQRPLLAIDAKFPISDFERLLNAADLADAQAERAARRALEARLRLEARKIAEKYIVPPITVEFAVMYLPTDALYAEAARMPGLIDDLGQRLHVMVMGPSLLPAMLRTVQLGYVTLALEQKAGQIADLLGATKREMLGMDNLLEKLSRTAGTMSRSIEDARRRTRGISRRLKDMETLRPDHARDLLGLAELEDADAETQS